MADRTADRSRRPGWLPLVGAAIVVPTVLAGLTQLWPRPQIEDRLTQAGAEALSGAGLPGAGLVLNGRDATISGLEPGQRQQAVDVVLGVPGIRVAAAPEDIAPDAGTVGGSQVGPAPAPAAEPFGLARRGEDIVVSGVVGSDDERDRLLAAATAAAGGRTVQDELTVTTGAPLPGGVSPASVQAAVGALGGAGGGNPSISVSDDGVTLAGAVPDDATRAATEQAVTAGLPGVSVNNQITVDPALSGGGAPATTELDAAAKQQLQAAVSRLLAEAPITFQPNSPALTEQGRASVARLLELVRGTPGARLQINGFVATGPSAGVLTAQQLSDLRAAAVRDALTGGGVAADHLVARGLGEGTTPAAQAAGRRVDVTVI